MAETVLVTGGTGSLGSEFVRLALDEGVDTIIVYSRDEYKQAQMAERYRSDRVRFVIGDVCDYTRLYEAMSGVDTVIHTAAMKQVPACESNPAEAVNTNVTGSHNVALAASRRGCHVVALSTDKATCPTNVYGATKLLADRIILAAGFTVVRCGNIFGSRGSVVPLFQNQREAGFVNVTDGRMTRYSIEASEVCGILTRAMRERIGARIIIPKMASYRLCDLAQAIAPACAIREVGARAGEQMHECLISEVEAPDVRDEGDHYVLDGRGDGSVSKLTSDRNDRWLTVDEMRRMA